MRPTGDHFYTTSAAERDNAAAEFGYANEGVACFVLQSPGVAANVQLYRLYSPATGDHFYTTSVTERDRAMLNFGYTDEGIACNVFSSAQPGAEPFYRSYNPGNGDHFYTTSAAEHASSI